MKLVNLKDDRSTALALLDKWDFKAPSYELMDQFRLSSTAIYPFKDGEEVLLLRYSPRDERTYDFVQAELDYIESLASSGVWVAELKLNRDGNKLLELEVNNKSYLASVFKRVKGQRLDRIPITNDMAYEIGRTLAGIHCIQVLDMEKGQLYDRPNHLNKLEWVEKMLIEFADQTLKEDLLTAVKSISEELESLPQNPNTYGLVQYDFELDNLFYDEEFMRVSVIDFDDSHYHWYVMDIINFIDNIQDELGDVMAKRVETEFLKGYRSSKAIPDMLIKNQALFRRYSNLISYVNALYAVSDLGTHPPQWMLDLKLKLENNMQSRLNKIL